MSAVFGRNVWTSTVLTWSRWPWRWRVRFVQRWRDGNVNSKCEFITSNEFVHGSRRDYIAPTNSNTVQPQVWKPVLSARVKTAVRGIDQILLSISVFEIEYWCVYTLHCASMYFTIRLKLLHTNTIFNFIWRTPFCVTFKCIAMLSDKNSSLLLMLKWVLCDWKQCF